MHFNMFKYELLNLLFAKTPITTFMSPFQYLSSISIFDWKDGFSYKNLVYMFWNIV